MLYTKCSAVFSECGQYRYLLTREWNSSLPQLTFVGLNPSKADEYSDDNTIRKLVKLADRNGYGSILVVNCFPLIETDSKKLLAVPQDELDRNMVYLQAHSKHPIVLGWGDHELVKLSGMEDKLRTMIPVAYCFAINKSGTPKHPLYLKDSSVLMEYRWI